MPAGGKRLLFIIIGLMATAIAIVGVWLPGVPTTFPLIVALWAFSKSSVRLERWVGHLPILKHALKEARRFEREHTIDRRVKVIATSSAWLSTLVVGIVTQSIIVTIIVAGMAVACSAFMIRVPSRIEPIPMAEPDESV